MIEKRQTGFYIDAETDSKMKDRTIALRMSMSSYISELIDLDHEFNLVEKYRYKKLEDDNE